MIITIMIIIIMIITTLTSILLFTSGITCTFNIFTTILYIHFFNNCQA